MTLICTTLAIWLAAFAAPARQKDLQELLQEGLDAYRAGDLETAQKLWREGLRLAEEQQDEALFVGSFHGNLGVVHSVAGNYDKAVEHFEKSVELARRAGDRIGLKNRLNNLGGMYLLLQQPDKALERFGEALTIARTLGDSRLEAIVLNNIAESYLLKGDPAEAAANLRPALELASEQSLAALQAKVLSNLGQVYAAQGNYPQALNHFRTAIALTQKLPETRARARALIRDYNRMGLLTRDMGDPLAAIALHQSAVEQARLIDSPRELSASRELLDQARALLDGTPETLHRLRIEGLKTMLARLRAHRQDAVARQVEQQIRKLEHSPTVPVGAAAPVGQPPAAESPSSTQAAGPPKLRSLQKLEAALAGAESIQQVAQRLERMAKDNPRDPTILYALGKTYETLAQRSFDFLRQNAPDSPYSLFLLANAHLKQNNFAAALPYLERAAAKAPNLRGLHAALAQVYDHTGKPEKVRDELAAERALGRPDCKTPAGALECAFAARRYDELATLAAAGDTPESHYWRLQAYNELARQAFARLVDLPPSVEAHVFHAEVERQRGRHQESVKHWQEALELAPEDPRLKTELAVSFFLARNYVAVRPIVEQLLRQYPDSAQLNYLQGDSLLYLQRAEEAIPFLEKAVTADPANLYAQAALGRGLVQLGRHQAAIPHLEKALPLDTDGSLHYQLARAYRTVGQREQAMEMLKKYRELQQASPSPQP